MFGPISLNINFFYYMKKKSYTTMDLLVDRGCLYLCAIVIKVIQGSLNKSSSTGSILNLFSHIRGFNVIHKMFIYLLSGIHRLVHSKGRLGCSNSWNFNSSGSIKFLLLLVINFIYLFYKGFVWCQDKWKSKANFKILPRRHLEQYTYLCAPTAVQG